MNMGKNGDIDIVILWVDGNDPEWQRQKRKYDVNRDQTVSDANINRYRDWNTLQYLLRGIEKYASWVRKVHLVTCGHYPEWLNRDNEKLHLVKHSDFIPEEVLPTFSSRAIDLNLHRIEGLAEQFIYFNDDMFILKELKPTMFFRNGLPCDVVSERAISCSGTEKAPYGHTLISDMEFIARHFNRKEVMKSNWKKILNVRYGKTFFYNLLMYFLPYKNFYGLYNPHIPTGYLKENFREVWEAEPELMKEVVSHRFRNVMDVNQYLFRYWPLVKGTFYPENIDKLGKVLRVYREENRVMDSIRKHSFPLLCLNDDCPDDAYERVSAELVESFESIFPQKSLYEL